MAKPKNTHQPLRSQPRWRTPVLAGLSSVLVGLGLVAVLTSRAAIYGPSLSGQCALPSPPAGVNIDEVEARIGMPLMNVDWDSVTDEQIKGFGYEPSVVRAYIEAVKKSIACAQGSAQNQAPVVINPTANSPQAPSSPTQAKEKLTGEGHIAPTSNADPSTLFVGTVANVTAGTTFDLLRGGWLIELRWQAPGGAQAFQVYGRDDGRQANERLLARVGSTTRSVVFGGFSGIALPPIHNQTYWLSVVPEVAADKLGTPGVVKTQVRCYVLWCQAQVVK